MIKKEEDRAIFWERQAKISKLEADYYQKALEEAHAIIGRIIHQYSARWDSVTLTKFYPTLGDKPPKWIPVTTEEILAERDKKKV